MSVLETFESRRLPQFELDGIQLPFARILALRVTEYLDAVEHVPPSFSPERQALRMMISGLSRLKKISALV